jgi:hypothetical protein
VKFARQLAAATLLVAIVVGIGLAWNHFAASTLIGNLPGLGKQVVLHRPGSGGGHFVGTRPGKGRNTPVIVLAPGEHPPKHLTGHPVIIYAKPMDLGLGSMFDPVNLPVLRHTLVIETGVIAAVVILDVARRRLRRARRNRLDSAESRGAVSRT